MSEVLMPITVKTVYTKEKLLELQKYFISQKKAFWILMAVASLLCFLAFAFAAVWGELDSIMWMSFIGVIILDVFYIFLYFIMPKFTINKSPLLDSEVTYEFEWDHFNYTNSNSLISGSSSVKYLALRKICKKGNTVYLKDKANRYYIVDLSETSGKDIAALRSVFENNFAEHDIIWN